MSIMEGILNKRKQPEQPISGTTLNIAQGSVMEALLNKRRGGDTGQPSWSASGSEDASMRQPPQQAEPEEKAGFVDGLLYGGKEALNPFSVDRGEQSKILGEGGTPALAGYLIGNIGTSIASNIALTSATGAVAAPLAAARTISTAKTVATTLFALYQGSGRDRIRSREDGGEWKPLDGGKGTATTLLTAGLELNPLLRASGKLNAALRTGAQGAGEFVLEKAHGGDNGNAAMAAAMGVVGASIPLYYMRGKGEGIDAVKLATAEDAITSMDATKTNTPEMFTRVQAKLQEMGTTLPEEIPSDFKRLIVGDKSAKLNTTQLDEAYEYASKKKGPVRLQEAYSLHQAGNAYGEIAGEMNADNLKKLGVEAEPGVIKRTLMSFFYVSREIDAKTGMNTAALQDKMGRMHNLHNTVTKHFSDRFAKLQDKAKKIGLSGEDVSELVSQENPERVAAIIKKHGQANVDEIRNGVEEGLSGNSGMFGYLQDLGYNIARRQNYITEKAVSSARIASVLQGQIESLPEALQGRSLDDIRAGIAEAISSKKDGALDALRASDKASKIVSLLDKTAKRINEKPIKAISEWNGLKDRLLNGARWVEDLEDVPESITEMSALFARKGSVPEEIRERDAWKLLGSYMNDNLRAAHFEDAINEGRMLSQTLEKMGMVKASGFFNDYLTDQAGGVRGLDAIFRKINTKLEYVGAEKLRKQISSGDVRMGKVLVAIPEFTSWLNSQVYTAKLALNVPGLVRNSTQFLTTTIPEVGGKYGVEKAFVAAKNITKGEGYAAVYKTLEEKGLLGMHGRLEASEFSQAFGGLKGKIDRFNSGGIVFGKEWPGIFAAYQATDKFNRAISWQMGKEIAGDILINKKGAVSFIENLDVGSKQELRLLLQKTLSPKEKLDAVHDLVGRYLIGKPHFDYSKANKAEWARLVGPYFSMFTTWPAMIGSDIAHTLSTKGFIPGGKKILSKYFPLYGLAMLANKYVEGSDSDVTKYLFENTTSFTPLDSVIPKNPRDNPQMGRSGVLNNPLLQTTGKVGSALAESVYSFSPKPLAKSFLNDIAPTYLPVVAPILNELNRWSRVKDGTKFTSQIANEYLGEE